MGEPNEILLLGMGVQEKAVDAGQRKGETLTPTIPTTEPLCL